MPTTYIPLSNYSLDYLETLIPFCVFFFLLLIAPPQNPPDPLYYSTTTPPTTYVVAKSQKTRETTNQINHFHEKTHHVFRRQPQLIISGRRNDWSRWRRPWRRSQGRLGH